MKTLGPIHVGQYAPDLPDFGSPGAENAFNCLPRIASYGPLPEASEITTTPMTEQAYRGISARNAAKLAYTYAGGPSSLWQAQGGVWSAINTGFAASSWDFAVWDNSRVVATALEENPQVITMGSPSFSDLYSGVNIKAKYCAVVREFLVFANIVDDDGANDNRVRWAGFDNIDTITPSAVTQSDFQDLQGDGGAIQRIVGGTEGVIFQESAIWRMTLAPPFVFRFDELEQSLGTIAPNSVIQYGDRIFFLAEDGFRMISPSSASQPIGEERVDRTVLADLDFSAVNNMSAALLEDEQTIMWAYPGAGAPGGRANKLIMYNFASNRWAPGEELVDTLFRVRSEFVDTDSLDTIATLSDDLPGNIDDKLYAGAGSSLGGVNHDGHGFTFTGPARTALFRTAEKQHVPGRRTLLNYVRPVVDGGASRIRVRTRNRQTDSPNTGPWVDENADGLCPVRANGRYLSYELEASQDFKDVIAIEPYGQPGGGR